MKVNQSFGFLNLSFYIKKTYLIKGWTDVKTSSWVENPVKTLSNLYVFLAWRDPWPLMTVTDLSNVLALMIGRVECAISFSFIGRRRTKTWTEDDEVLGLDMVWFESLSVLCLFINRYVCLFLFYNALYSIFAIVGNGFPVSRWPENVISIFPLHFLFSRCFQIFLLFAHPFSISLHFHERVIFKHVKSLQKHIIKLILV